MLSGIPGSYGSNGGNGSAQGPLMQTGGPWGGITTSFGGRYHLPGVFVHGPPGGRTPSGLIGAQ